MEIPSAEESKWLETKNKLEKPASIQLGTYLSYIIRKTPRRLLHILSYYKFAAKLIGSGKSVLDVGCSEGLGTVLLAEFARQCVGSDIDAEAICSASLNFTTDKIKFVCGDFLKQNLGIFDAVTNFDVIEHIYPENENTFLLRLCKHLNPTGILIIGTPNITSDVYASPVTKAGHVNLYSADRLRASLEKYFNTVFIFSANDEIVHTGFYPMAHYLIGVGTHKKT